MRDPREEAERLVATALAALSMAANSTAGFATGSAECCVCPVCKAIAAARDPDPDFAERLATGVGEVAVGLASVLRSFGAPANPRSSSPSGTAEAPEAGQDSDVWQAATQETPPPTATSQKIDPDTA
jgi:hypothetical protein